MRLCVGFGMGISMGIDVGMGEAEAIEFIAGINSSSIILVCS